MKLTRRWNAFVKSLVATKNAWDSLAELMHERPNTDNMPNSVQKIMSSATVKRGAKFDIAMPRLLDHFRRYGGFGELVIEPKSKPKSEKPKEKT